MTVAAFEAILDRILGPVVEGALLPTFDPQPWLNDEAPDDAEGSTAALTAAFLVALGGPAQATHARAIALLEHPPTAAPSGLAALYRRCLELIRAEIEHVSGADPAMAARLAAAAEGLAVSHERDGGDVAELVWSVFCPEAVGIRGHESERESALRSRRSVVITTPNPRPIDDPAGQILVTSNVLLTVPASSTSVDALPYPADLRRDLTLASVTAQAHWYDHPIQIGVEPAGNELQYGLHQLDEAVAFERRRRPSTGRATCLLSVSVTHPSLHGVAGRYLEAELRASEPLHNLDVFVFTEDDTERLVDEVLVPAARVLLAVDAGPEAGPEMHLRDVFGVDGAYGRHYSFLKAITALWQVLIDPRVRGTFKIDLDQVFPQDVLVAETGRSAFEHLETPLWGALGVDAGGRTVELGMIAGALVNERDIGRGLFTPDVAYPQAPLAPDQVVFFSALPQALSTRAEMMERYDGPERDGTTVCLERVHVTGGTNGILVDALRRHRPFTPSFVGRAEDQAYLLSVLGSRADDPGTTSEASLAYLHAAGLVMRHDKEAFAGEAIAAAEAGKLIGDDVRVLQFSAYGQAIGTPVTDVASLKDILDPFTGAFISRLPVTVALLRFAFRIVRAFDDGRARLAVELAQVGAPRIDAALTFTGGDGLRAAIAHERAAWDRYYDVLDALEAALAGGDQAALDLQARAREIVAHARVSSGADRPIV